jgi:hypothetical protein
MATNDADDGSLLRTVTPLTGSSPNQQMDAIGWLIFIGMAIVLLPLLPVFVAVWLVSKLTGR